MVECVPKHVNATLGAQHVMGEEEQAQDEAGDGEWRTAAGVRRRTSAMLSMLTLSGWKKTDRKFAATGRTI